MQVITEEYKKLNMALHEVNAEYGKSGKLSADPVLHLAKALHTYDILDYGCGKSTLQMNRPFKINQYDPAVKKYEALPNPADIVVCTDVLEHIEPECLEQVMRHLFELTKKVGFFKIATRPAKKILADGRNAHLIVRPMLWWLKLLDEIGFGIKENKNEKDQEFDIVVYKKETM